MESVNSLRISAPQWWPLREGRDGKCEGRNEKCEFLARESVSSSPIVRIFGKGKCKFIANFSATMVTSLPSLSLSLCLYLSLSPKVPHAQYRKRFRASYNKGSASALPIIHFRRINRQAAYRWLGFPLQLAVLLRGSEADQYQQQRYHNLYWKRSIERNKKPTNFILTFLCDATNFDDVLLCADFERNS